MSFPARYSLRNEIRSRSAHVEYPRKPERQARSDQSDQNKGDNGDSAYKG